MHERELALISDFYHDAVSGESRHRRWRRSNARGRWNPRSWRNRSSRRAAARAVREGGFLLGWADGKISPAERTKIGEFAKALDVSDATVARLEAEVKDFLLRPFANLANIDAATVIAKKLGI